MELGGGSKKHVEDHMTWVVEILAESEVVESCTLGTLRIPSFAEDEGQCEYDQDKAVGTKEYW